MSVDIVNLIESNPITKLNGSYQSKLIEKVQKYFSNYEQQLFLASFYCYLKYDYKNDFVIDLDNVWKWLGFSQKVNAKMLLEKVFSIEKDYKILLCRSAEQKKDARGGHNKETIMLNVDTFKKFCLKAGTKKADEIHDYFIKLENIMHEIANEECSELKMQLEQQKEQQKTELQLLEHKNKIESEKQKVIEREKILLAEYATIGCIFYVIKIKTLESGQYIVKVGESRKGVQERYKEHKRNYPECLLLDCFSVNKSKDFETFIKDHESVRGSIVKNLTGHENETELFLIGRHLSYQTLLTIIHNNIKYFNNNDTNKLELEIEKLKIMLEMKTTHNDNVLLEDAIKEIKKMSSKIDNLEKSNQELLQKYNASQTKLVTGFNAQKPNLGPRLQQIHPETMQLVKVFESVTECMNNNKNIKRPSIIKAINENTVYCGFRWLLVERNHDSSVVVHVPPTKQTKTQHIGYIAQLNNEKTDIVNVYLDRKTAAHNNGYESASMLDAAVKNFSRIKGSYFCLYETCDDGLRSAFEKKYGKEPILYKAGVGQFNSMNQLVREFGCKYDCIKQLKMSDKTLAKALTHNIAYNGFYFKELGSKLTCF